MFYVEKTKDHVTPIDDVDILDVACGTNHTVSSTTVNLWYRLCKAYKGTASAKDIYSG